MSSIAILIKSHLIIVVATALCRRAGSENPEAPRHNEAATAKWREAVARFTTVIHDSQLTR